MQIRYLFCANFLLRIVQTQCLSGNLYTQQDSAALCFPQETPVLNMH